MPLKLSLRTITYVFIKCYFINLICNLRKKPALQCLRMLREETAIFDLIAKNKPIL